MISRSRAIDALDVIIANWGASDDIDTEEKDETESEKLSRERSEKTTRDNKLIRRSGMKGELDIIIKQLQVAGNWDIVSGRTHTSITESSLHPWGRLMTQEGNRGLTKWVKRACKRVYTDQVLRRHRLNEDG
jgi:hypothetical protein